MHPADRIIYQIYVPALGGRQPSSRVPALVAAQRLTGHLLQLGVNTVMLTPIFPAPSEHRYDCTDYFQVDPALAGTAGPRQAHRVFTRLLEVWGSAGLGVVLDLALNHASLNYPIEELPADGRPRRRPPHGRQESSWGFGYWDQAHQPTQRFLLSVARYWLENAPIAGYRLDYLPGVDADFRQQLLQTIGQVSRDVFLLGECWGGHQELARLYAELAPLGLDSLLEFPAQGALLEVLAWQTPPALLGRVLGQAYQAPGGKAWPCWFLDSHDHMRLADAVGGDWARLTLAASIQFAQSGPVCIFCGDELAAQAGTPLLEGFTSQARQPAAAPPDPSPMFQFYRRLCQCRAHHPALRQGDAKILNGPAGCLLQVKHTADEVILVVANLTDHAKQLRLELDRLSGPFARGQGRELLTGQRAELEPSRLVEQRWVLPCRLPARTARYWLLLPAGTQETRPDQQAPK